jgi:hypothetical protein
LIAGGLFSERKNEPMKRRHRREEDYKVPFRISGGELSVANVIGRLFLPLKPIVFPLNFPNDDFVFLNGYVDLELLP